MYNFLKFDLGRNALRHIIQTYSIKQIHIPYYLCDVVRHTLVEVGCKPIFYHIDDEFFPVDNFDRNDYILYPNYWGICGENVEKLAGLCPRLIIDNAHAFFDAPKGLACFNAGHKFGFKYSYAFIKGSSMNLPDELLNEELILERKNKFLKLHKKYKNLNLLNIPEDSIPFCYPCLADTIENADRLVTELKNEGKVIYRYWNSMPTDFNEYKFYSRLVPIPITD